MSAKSPRTPDTSLADGPRRVALALALTAAAAAFPAAAGARGAFVHGSSGLRDPFFPRAGNGGYDVSHYALRLRYRPRDNWLRATAKIRATATQNLSRFDLDFRRLHISSLRVGRREARFRRHRQELVIKPRHRLRDGEPFKVRVRYRGKPHPVTDPDGSLDGWIPTDDGAFVANEPQGAPTWFPCNDHPTDKATYDFRVTVPKGTTAVANGTLENRIRHHRLATFVWSEGAPMATYLATVTTGRFNVSRSRANGVPSLVALDPRDAQSRTVLKRIPSILRLFGSRFGDYPFGQTGAIVDHAPSVGYALETQTRPLFDRAPDEITLAHELAHQWFGDAVTPSRWPDIWLNEGFATWSEWYWGQHRGGETVTHRLNRLYGVPAANAAFWNPPPGRPGTPKRLFDGTIYIRGGMTLELLRQQVGNAAFFRTLDDWVDQHRFSNAATQDFIDLAEHDSGMDLGDFFDAWLFQTGKPALP